MARIYDSEGNTARADSLYQVALQSPIWATRARIYEALYERNLQSGRYQEAVTYMKLYQQAIDSFYTHRQAKEIQELQTKYDYEVLFREKVETENRLLRLAIGTGCLLLFGSVFGFLGMLFAVPVFAVLYYLASLWINGRLKSRTLPLDTSAYIDATGIEDGKLIHTDTPIPPKDEA